jgi:hypothetical protein
VTDLTVEFTVSWPRRTASVILSCGLLMICSLMFSLASAY